MEIMQKNPQLSDILDALTSYISAALNGDAPHQYAYRLMAEDKVHSERSVDITLEIALTFQRDRVVRPPVDVQPVGVVEALQAVLPHAFTYAEDPDNQTQISESSVCFILDSLESVAGRLLHHRSEPGSCLLFYRQGIVLFLRHGLH